MQTFPARDAAGNSLPAPNEHPHPRNEPMSSGEVRQVNGKRVASPEYRSWQMMKNRCLNPNATDWEYYGARGITVCQRWHDFDYFLEDMGRRPTPKHTLERKESNGPYNKKNCIWATRQQQARNRGYAKLTMVDAQPLRSCEPRFMFCQFSLSPPLQRVGCAPQYAR